MKMRHAHRKVREGTFIVLKDGSFRAVPASPVSFSQSVTHDRRYGVYFEQVIDAAWNKLMGPEKITARQAKRVPFAGDIRKLGLSPS
jgi:hypothetical protein